MGNIATMARRGARDERGATGVEYGIIVGLIAAVIILSVTALGLRTFDLFDGFRALYEAAVS